MKEKKFNKVLTIILVIVVIAIFVIIGFWGYDLYQRYYINTSANEYLEQEFSTNRIKVPRNTTGEEELQNVSLNIDVNEIESNNSTTSNRVAKQTYKGYAVLGRIEIPKTKVNYPVLDRTSDASMKVSVGVLYGVGLNEIGNTVIAGHNYRNGTFFSNNKNLQNGDLIYITDLTGRRIKYTIYNVYETSSSDFEYATRDTAGKREISLTTCTADVNARLVIWARED